MKTIDMKQFIPEIIKSGRNGNEYVLHIDEHDNEYFVWYETHIYNQKGLVGKKRYSEKIPKYLDIDSEGYIVLGLLQGEMNKTYRQTLTFANCEVSIMNRVLTWFEQTTLATKLSWRWYVRVNLREPSDDKVAKTIEDQVINHWIKECNLRREEANPKTVSYVRSTRNKALDGSGTLMVEIGGPIFIQTMQKMVADITAAMPLQTSEHITAYMKGIIAAEGCINYRKESSHRRIFITATKDHERQIFHECLNKIGIETSDCASICDLIISGKDNLERVRELNLTIVHPEKHKIFLAILNSYRGRWPKS